jgi:hypothetical protein
MCVRGSYLASIIFQLDFGQCWYSMFVRAIHMHSQLKAIVTNITIK